MGNQDPGLGKHNRFALTMKADTTITCGGSEADVTGNHVILPCRAKLIKVKCSGLAGAALAACDIKVYKGTTKSGVAILSAAMDLKTAGQNKDSGVIADAFIGGVFDEDTEFCISENGTNTKTIAQLQVTLMFRDHDV